jgi:hypothetical protein
VVHIRKCYWIVRRLKPRLLLSGKKDEMWPSTEMSELIMQRLKNNDFSFPFEHMAFEGGHAAPLGHFDVVEAFLQTHVQSEDSSVCGM